MSDLNNNLPNMDFPNIAGSGNRLNDGADAFRSPQGANDTGGDDANVEALVSLVQDLNQQNHDLLNRVTQLDNELTRYKQHVESSGQSQQGTQADPSIADDSSLSANEEQVANLLNHLEFAQQTNQRQTIRIESLSAQLEASHERVSQLESENGVLQGKCSDQRCRLGQFEEECNDLRLRLQRQQRYTLQFKAALEKCLEVPPPAYSLMGDNQDFTLADTAPVTETQPLVASGSDVDSPREDSNWLVQPLFPKLKQIQSWGDIATTTHGWVEGIDETVDPAATLQTDAHDDGVDLPATPLHVPSAHGSSTVDVPKVFENFPSSRFSNTLSTLAQTTLPEDSPNQDSLSQDALPQDALPQDILPPEKPVVRTGMTQPMSQPESISPSVSIWEEPAAGEPTTDNADGHYVPGVATNEHFADGASMEFLEDDWDHLSKGDGEAIAPFPATDTPHPQSIAPNEAELWQSLTKLIDLSATDGLNLPGVDDNTSVHHSPNPQGDQNSGEGLDSPVQEDLNGTSANHQAIESDTPVAPATAVPAAKQPHTVAKGAPKRSLDLPSFKPLTQLSPSI